MRLGSGVRIRAGARLEAFIPEGTHEGAPELSIGDGANIGQDCHIVCARSIVIGRGSLIGARVSVLDVEHGETAPGMSREMGTQRCAPVVIGERVWIGNGAVVTAGVRIGEAATVGANAVVTHDVAAGHVVGGVPARIIRTASEVLGGDEA
ncbi:MAG: acyltransferase [Coriobacteriia bacterium]